MLEPLASLKTECERFLQENLILKDQLKVSEDTRQYYKDKYDKEIEIRNTAHQRIPLLQWIIGDFEGSYGAVAKEEAHA